MKYDVFISCKSEDYAKAESVYHWLTDKGYRPFFAPVSLRISEIHGEPVVFGDEIDAALEEADNMIVYASQAKYVKTGYVKDEWRTFVEEQRAGRKTGALVTVLDSINIADLPIRLRSVQSFTPSNYQEGILRFLGNPSIQFEQHPINKSNQQDKESFVKDSINRAVLSEVCTNLQKELPKSAKTYRVKDVELTMIAVEGGLFEMGGAKDGSDSKPIHEVVLNNYAIGQTQVTQELWEAVMGSNPSKWKGLKLPVDGISWDDCQLFIGRLNELTDLQFRLPVVAEWEYAARGGKKSKGYRYSGSDNIDEVAWYWNNSNRQTHVVATKVPNELDIYDMSGNVWEWCQDRYEGEQDSLDNNKDISRIICGGSWAVLQMGCQINSIGVYPQSKPSNGNGIRLALSHSFNN